MFTDVGRLVAAEVFVAITAGLLVAAGAGRWLLVICLAVVGGALVWGHSRPGAPRLLHRWTVLRPVVRQDGEPTSVCATGIEFLVALEMSGEDLVADLRAVVRAATVDDSQLSAVEIYLGSDLTGAPRTTLVLLWLHPVAAHRAVQRRGGGIVGALACLRAAGGRLQRLPAGATRLLSAEELTCLMPPEHRTHAAIRGVEYGDETLARWVGAALSTPGCRSLVIGFDQADRCPIFDHAASARRAR